MRGFVDSDGGGTGSRRPAAVALRVVAVLLLLAASVLAATAAPVHAALAGRTDFQIDGNTAGPNDWDAPPTSLVDLVEVADACGNGVLDPTTLSGKLEDLDLANPRPEPGNVTASADLCHGWYALDAAAGADGGYSLVLYGAWEREDTKAATGGESTVFFPLIGPAPGNGDDLLVAFEFDDSAGGGENVSVLAWDGAGWVPRPISPSSFEAAVDDESGPSFGEFALDLGEAGVATQEDCSGFELLYIFSRTGQFDANADLQDFVGPVAMSISPCAEMELTKTTTPATPVPPASFEVTVARAGGGLVTENPDATSISETLTVPGSATVPLDGLVPADDYVVSEVSAPDGWDLESILCTALDPATGDIGTFDLTDPGATFPVVPGSEVACVLANVGPPTLTVVKAGLGEDSEFDFSVSGAGDAAGFDESFVLGNVGSWSSGAVSPGNYEITEVLPVDPEGWELLQVYCIGTTDTSTDVGSGSATVTLEPGNRAVCTFVNRQQDLGPPPATLAIVKSVPAPDGTSFPIDVQGPGVTQSPVVLTPPDSSSVVLEVTPAEGGSDYTVTEEVPDGWQQVGTSCDVGSGGGFVPGGQPAVVRLAPGDEGVCVVYNEPIPPPSLTVVKAGLGEASEFDFSVTGPEPAGGFDKSFVLGNEGSWSSGPLEPGDYTVTEVPPTQPPGWELQEISCVGASGVVTDVGGGTATVTVEPGDEVACSFVNVQVVEPPPATLTIVKYVPEGESGSFPIEVTGPGVPPDDSSVELTPPDDSSVVLEVTPQEGGSDYTLEELVPDGWQAVATSCQVGTGLVGGTPGGPLTLRLLPGDNAVCSFANEPVPPASLTVVKAGLGEASEFDFSVTGQGAPGGVEESFALGNVGSWSSGPLAPGEYEVSEVIPAEPPGWELRSILCFGDEDSQVAVPTANVTLDPGERVVCTFLNVQTVPATTLTIVKNVSDPDGTSFPIEVTGPGVTQSPVVLTPPDESSAVLEVEPGPAGSDYTIAETVPEGWQAVSSTCGVDGEELAGPPGGPVTITLAEGDNATCVFENQLSSPVLRPPATLTVAKVTQPANTLPPGADGFGIQVRTPSLTDKLMLGDGDAQTYEDVKPGTVTITEAVPSGWAAEVNCDAPFSDRGSGRVELDLRFGDDVTCTYTNVLLGVITIVKEAEPQGDTTFPFTSSYTKKYYAQFVLDDDGDDVADPEQGLYSNVSRAVDLIPGQYSVDEDVPDGWTTESIICEGIEPTAVNEETGYVEGIVEPGTDATCTYRNVQVDTGGPTEPPEPPGGGGGQPELPDTGSDQMVLVLLGLALTVSGAVFLRLAR